MIKIYLRQAWQLLKQNPLFSGFYIVGTGVAIAMTMTLMIIYYVKMAPVYPELNRDRTLVCKSMTVEFRKKSGISSSSLSYAAVRDYFYPLKDATAVTAIYDEWDATHTVESAAGDVLSAQAKYTDTDFWQVFTFSFVSGKPFSEADFNSGLRTAVVSESMAQRLFGTSAEVVGRTFQLDADEYKACGVVRDVSFVTPATYADVWIPYTVNPSILQVENGADGLLGEMGVYMLAPNRKAMESIASQVCEGFRRLSISQKEFLVQLNGQPVPYWMSTFYEFSNVGPNWMELLKTFGTLLFALLFIPALNLAGMISSRMEHRLPELGLRKAFGAPKRVLLGQVLTENFLLTLLGGAFGLALSYAMIYSGRNWLPTLFDKIVTNLPEGVDTFFSPAMLFNPTVFGITLGVCMVLNLVSALIPAVNALRKDIIYSLNNKK